MEYKNFFEYCKEDQKELLMHWWDYYGEDVYTFDELLEFSDLIEKDVKKIFFYALISFVSGCNNKGLLVAMRHDRVEKFLKEISNFDELPEAYKKLYTEAEKNFTKLLVDSYNNPELAIPLAQEELINQIMDEIKEQELNKPLSPKKVQQIFRNCLFKEEELENNQPLCDFTEAEGIKHNAFFHTGRLNSYKKEINEILDCIPNIDKGVYFTNLCFNKDGNLWTGDHNIIEQLIILGIGSETLSYPLKKDLWFLLPDGLPYVIKNKEKENSEIIGHNPSEFNDYIEKFKTKQK